VRSILFDVLVSAGVVGLTSLGIFERETPTATMWLGYVMAVALLFRRRWSMWSMAVISLAALMQVIEHDAHPVERAHRRLTGAVHLDQVGYGHGRTGRGGDTHAPDSRDRSAGDRRHRG
jgi:hypothetical protein